MPRRTEADYLRILKPKKLGILEPFQGITKQISHYCLVCGYGKDGSWRPIPHNLEYNKGCPSCNKVARITKKQFEAELTERRINLLGNLVNNNTPTNMQCMVCNYVWKGTRRSIVNNGAGCPECGRRKSSRLASKKQFKLGKRVVEVQGYEDIALEWILSNTGIKPKHIQLSSDNIPVIEYMFKGRKRRHYPDMFIPSKNIICEVKSVYTLGLYFIQNNWYYQTRAKARAAIKAGFRYVLFLADKRGRKVDLPKRWYDMSRKELVTYLEIRSCL